MYGDCSENGLVLAIPDAVKTGRLVQRATPLAASQLGPRMGRPGAFPRFGSYSVHFTLLPCDFDRSGATGLIKVGDCRDV